MEKDPTYDKFSNFMMENFAYITQHNTAVWDMVGTPVFERVGRILNPLIGTRIKECFKEI